MRISPTERIICLTEETVETFYLIGDQDRIVGVTGYSVRLPIVRTEKERVAAFTSAKIDKILSLKPDLVLAFSDLQAKIAVMTYNLRDIAGILLMVRHLGAAFGVGKVAGGVDVFLELSSNQVATDRIVTSEQVITAAPDVIVASWCGKKSGIVHLETGVDGQLCQPSKKTAFMRPNPH